jgi:hypothetical protein
MYKIVSRWTSLHLQIFKILGVIHRWTTMINIQRSIYPTEARYQLMELTYVITYLQTFIKLV